MTPHFRAKIKISTLAAPLSVPSAFIRFLARVDVTSTKMSLREKRVEFQRKKEEIERLMGEIADIEDNQSEGI